MLPRQGGLLVAACVMGVSAGCGDVGSKSVTYEEEVRLNTGAVIWVKRTDHFRRASEPGNPLQGSWWPGVRRYEFSYNGRSYSYQTTAGDSLGAIMLFARDGGIVVIDGTKGCGKPGYAEFRWDGTAWQRHKVGADVVGQPRNLMHAYSDERPWGDRISADDKSARDSSPRGPRIHMVVEPSILANC